MNTGRFAVLVGLVGLGASLFSKAARRKSVLIDPDQCRTCGGCTTFCVKNPSAVKAVNDFGPCGYCVYCYGYYPQNPTSNPNGRVCPTGALKRRRVNEFEYEYTIDEAVCIGCGKCVARCRSHGNKSLRLVVRGQLCLECNTCRIVENCPHRAIRDNPVNT